MSRFLLKKNLFLVLKYSKKTEPPNEGVSVATSPAPMEKKERLMQNESHKITLRKSRLCLYEVLVLEGNKEDNSEST